jgi:hypothetical protein
MVFHHFLDLLPQVAAELMNRYLSHEAKCTRSWYNAGAGVNRPRRRQPQYRAVLLYA